jgi:septum formation protein
MPPPAPLILASRSARRAQLLREAGYAFVQVDPPFADPPQPESHGHPEGLTMELAERKVRSLREAGAFDDFPEGVIVAADTVCVGIDGRLLGQPATRAEAAAMLGSFLGQAHRVVTGVAAMDRNDVHPHGFADMAVVVIERIAEAEVELYLDTQQWRGKAGGYNLFDRLAAGWPIHVEGDPTTVVGLPMRKLTAYREQRSIHPSAPAENTPAPFQA